MKVVRYNDKMWFGKHKDKSVSDILKIDPPFLVKILKEGKIQFDERTMSVLNGRNPFSKSARITDTLSVSGERNTNFDGDGDIFNSSPTTAATVSNDNLYIPAPKISKNPHYVSNDRVLVDQDVRSDRDLNDYRRIGLRESINVPLNERTEVPYPQFTASQLKKRIRTVFRDSKSGLNAVQPMLMEILHGVDIDRIFRIRAFYIDALTNFFELNPQDYIREFSLTFIYMHNSIILEIETKRETDNTMTIIKYNEVL